LTANQITDLVAPIALYPDPLLTQVLVASTYPLEVVEAQQWLQQNRSLSGTRLMDAARQQNWDPSVQALVAFFCKGERPFGLGPAADREHRNARWAIGNRDSAR
jgi:hypothetical protein